MIKQTTSIAVAGSLLVVSLLAGCSSNSPTTVAHTNATPDRSAATTQNVPGVAAQYNGVDITEQEVSDYIAQYRLYSNVEDDEAWATLLDESNTSAEGMRASAVREIATDLALAAKAEELGITISDSELDEEIVARRALIGLTGDKEWKDVLDTSEYTEEGYRKDLRNEILLQRAYEREGKAIELSEAQLNSFARDNASAYIGKKVIVVSYSVDNNSKGVAFASSFDGTTRTEDFKTRAAQSAEKGDAMNVSTEKWTCLGDTTMAIVQGVADKHPGDVLVVTEADGTLDVVFVSEEYAADFNGYPVLANMPSDIRKKLEEDCLAYLRDSAISTYRTDLLSDDALTIYDMPTGLPYDVDMSLSSYGKQTTAEEDEAAAQQLVDDHLSELENAENTVNIEEVLNSINND